MDKIKENIKMFEKAEEVQKQWKPQEGDTVVIPKGTGYESDWSGNKLTEETIVTMLHNTDGGRYYGYAMVTSGLEVGSVFSEDPSGCTYKKYIWLPTQSQLQEMIIKHGHHNSGILFGLMQFSDKYSYNDKSMEQLWLAFVMKEKYNKVWNGEDWVKDGE